MSITPTRARPRQRIASFQINQTFDAIDSIRGAPSHFTRTTQGSFPKLRSDRRPPSPAGTMKRPFDIVFYYETPSTATDKFALYTWDAESRGAIAWIAGAKVAITASGFTFDGTDMRWELDTAITATTCIYLKVDREAGTAQLNTAASFPNGNDNYEVFPLYYVPWDATPTGTVNDHIDTANVIDMRGTFHWVAGA